MEVVLKVLKDGLTVVYVPYAYGFAIILLIVILKGVTFPLDGHLPLGWSDSVAYLVLPVLLVVSQYVSMEIMKLRREEVLEEANSSPGKPIPDSTGPRKGKRTKRKYMITVVQKVECDSCATIRSVMLNSCSCTVIHMHGHLYFGLLKKTRFRMQKSCQQYNKVG